MRPPFVCHTTAIFFGMTISHDTGFGSRMLIAGGTLLASVALLTGCSLGNTSAFDVKVGDCMNEQSATEVTDVPVVDCGEPHDEEIYHLYDVADDIDVATIEDEAWTTCEDEFEPFVGLAYDESVLDYYILIPTEESYANGDRTVNCIVYEPDTKPTGSLAGAKR